MISEGAAPVLSSLERLQQGLESGQELVNVSQKWVPELRNRLNRIATEKDPLPQVASFFALWSLDLPASRTVAATPSIFAVYDLKFKYSRPIFHSFFVLDSAVTRISPR